MMDFDLVFTVLNVLTVLIITISAGGIGYAIYQIIWSSRLLQKMRRDEHDRLFEQMKRDHTDAG